MMKPFARWIWAPEIFFKACAAAAPAVPCLADTQATEAALQRRPLVRGARGLVYTGTDERARRGAVADCAVHRSAVRFASPEAAAQENGMQREAPAPSRAEH